MDCIGEIKGENNNWVDNIKERVFVRIKEKTKKENFIIIFLSGKTTWTFTENFKKLCNFRCLDKPVESDPYHPYSPVECLAH